MNEAQSSEDVCATTQQEVSLSNEAEPKESVSLCEMFCTPAEILLHFQTRPCYFNSFYEH